MYVVATDLRTARRLRKSLLTRSDTKTSSHAFLPRHKSLPRLLRSSCLEGSAQWPFLSFYYRAWDNILALLFRNLRDSVESSQERKLAPFCETRAKILGNGCALGSDSTGVEGTAAGSAMILGHARYKYYSTTPTAGACAPFLWIHKREKGIERKRELFGSWSVGRLVFTRMARNQLLQCMN